MKHVVILVSCPILSLNAGELLEEEVAMLSTGWATASDIRCEPMPLGGVQGAADVVIFEPPIHWLFCFDGCGLA